MCWTNSIHNGTKIGFIHHFNNNSVLGVPKWACSNEFDRNVRSRAKKFGGQLVNFNFWVESKQLIVEKYFSTSSDKAIFSLYVSKLVDHLHNFLTGWVAELSEDTKTISNANVYQENFDFLIQLRPQMYLNTLFCSNKQIFLSQW